MVEIIYLKLVTDIKIGYEYEYEYWLILINQNKSYNDCFFISKLHLKKEEKIALWFLIGNNCKEVII